MSLACLAVRGHAQLGYTAIDEGVQPYQSIASPAHRLPSVSSCDECVAQVQLPFAFPWFGERLVQVVSISSNGQVSMDARLDPECCDPILGGIPDPLDQNHDAIFVAKQDLNPGSGGEVHAATLGSAPNRRWVVEFAGVPFFPALGRVDAQIQLHEADGAITLHWGPAGDAGGQQYSAGVEAAGGEVGTPALAGAVFDSGGLASGVWPAGLRCRFLPTTTPDLVVEAITPSRVIASPGSSIAVEVTVRKYGTGPVGPVRVDLFVNPPAPPVMGQTSPLTTTVSFGGEPGIRAVALFSPLSAPFPGTWELYALVNTDGLVAEVDPGNNLGGIARVFWAGPEPLPFQDDFDGGLRWVIDPAVPAGGATQPCEGTVPCEHARATLEAALQSTCAPGSHALRLDCDGPNDWLGLAAPAVADDPDRWEDPFPAGMPSHVGSAMVVLDASDVGVLTLQADLAFRVDEPHDQQLVIEADDGHGWRRVAGPAATAGVGGRVYRPPCLVPGGCGGGQTPWICAETVDLSPVATGGAVLLRLRWLVHRQGVGPDATAVLVDRVRITGSATGLRVQDELPLATRTVAAGSSLALALPFQVQAVGESHTLRGLTLTAAGTLVDDQEVAAVYLHEDVDGSRTLTPPDLLLASGSFPVDDGSLALTLPAPAILAPGGFRRYLVLVDLSPLAAGGRTLSPVVSAVVAEDASGAPALTAGLPAPGDTLVVQLPHLDLAPGLWPPGPGLLAAAGTSDVVVAQWRCTGGGSLGAVRGLVLTASGTGDDALGLQQVRLVQELPGLENGRLDPGEPVQASGTYASDNGALPLTFASPLTLLPGEVASLLYVVDLDPTAAMGGSRTYTATVTGPADVDADAATISMPPGGVQAPLTVVAGCPRSLCGDCNLDGVVSIVDALVAAQHAAGLFPLAGNQFSNCNVTGDVEPDPAAQVGVLDALAIAQWVAGLPAPLLCC